MNIPEHLLNPTREVSVKESDNTNTPSGSSSKRTLGSISASPSGKHVKFNVLSPTCITTASGAGKGLSGKALGKPGPRVLHFRLQDLQQVLHQQYPLLISGV